MRSLPIVLAILAGVLYLVGPPAIASQDAVVAFLTAWPVPALAALLLGIYEWLTTTDVEWRLPSAPLSPPSAIPMAVEPSAPQSPQPPA